MINLISIYLSALLRKFLLNKPLIPISIRSAIANPSENILIPFV